MSVGACVPTGRGHTWSPVGSAEQAPGTNRRRACLVVPSQPHGPSPPRPLNHAHESRGHLEGGRRGVTTRWWRPGLRDPDRVVRRRGQVGRRAGEHGRERRRRLPGALGRVFRRRQDHSNRHPARSTSVGRRTPDGDRDRGRLDAAAACSGERLVGWQQGVKQRPARLGDSGGAARSVVGGEGVGVCGGREREALDQAPRGWGGGGVSADANRAPLISGQGSFGQENKEADAIRCSRRRVTTPCPPTRSRRAEHAPFVGRGTPRRSRARTRPARSGRRRQRTRTGGAREVGAAVALGVRHRGARQRRSARSPSQSAGALVGAAPSSAHERLGALQLARRRTRIPPRTCAREGAADREWREFHRDRGVRGSI